MSGADWTPQQDALLWDRAGLVRPDELARLLSEIGPPRSESAVRTHARALDIPLGKRRRRVFDRNGLTPKERGMLRELAGVVPVEEITRRMNERFHTRRRPNGVQTWLSRLGLSAVCADLLTAREIYRILCTNPSEVARLLAIGAIVSVRKSAGQGGEWGVRPAALETYMREHPERLNLSLMLPGRWRDIAQAILRRSPYLTSEEAARYLKLSASELRRRLHGGRIPGAIKASRTWRIPLKSVIELAEQRDHAAAVLSVVEIAVDALSGGWRTAESIAAETGLNRHVVRDAMLRARQRGVPVEGRPGVGYRFNAALECAS
jgi:excisionase family DNA binding protein